MITKKNSCGSKIPLPLNCSSGPSLNYTCFKQATSSKRNTSLKAVKKHSLKFNDLEKSSLSRKNVEEKVQPLMHQKILTFSSAYSCASFLPQKPLPLFAEEAVIPHNRCQLAIKHGMREQSYVREVKVAEHSFGSLWLCVICQIMARARLLLTSWNLASEKCTDERFWLTGKNWRFRSFHGNMNDWIQP